VGGCCEHGNEYSVSMNLREFLGCIRKFFYVFLTVHHNIETCFNYQLNAQFLRSITIYTSMLHYNPRHVSSSTMLIFRRSDCIITASGIVTLYKRPYSTPVESGLQELCIKLLMERILMNC
jgi:hypothetical protein